MSQYGIDVAKWQGIIDWEKFKADNKEFAILKVTDKTNKVEEAFERNYCGCINCDIPVGVYRYVYAADVAAAKTEANAIVSAIKDKDIKLGVWLDMEDTGIKGAGRETLTSIIRAEAEIFQANGHKVGIYCNRDWYLNVLDSAVLAQTYPFWIARYPAADNGTIMESLSPKDLAGCKVWQYSSKGTVNGISGNVDLDIAFADLAELMSPDKPVTYFNKYTGKETSIVPALTDMKEDSSFPYRGKVACANGIVSNLDEYKGSVQQNTEMVRLLKLGKLIKP